jgi:glycosyltransferase involved in cell wall biosynthesis
MAIRDSINIRDEAPLISIILVCLNAGKTIELTILSIINLDYPSIEFIIIDGESNDGTRSIIDRYKSYIDRVIIEKDNGVYDAMNKGTKIAKGEFLYFVGSDDIVVNSWHNLIGKLKFRNTIYYGNVYFPVTNQIYLGKVNFFRLLTINICQQAIFYPRAVFEKYQYSCNYPVQSDYHLNLLINSDPDFKFKYIDLLIAVFSEKGISTMNIDRNFVRDHLMIIKKHYPFFIYIYTRIRLSLWKWLN